MNKRIELLICTAIGDANTMGHLMLGSTFEADLALKIQRHFKNEIEIFFDLLPKEKVHTEDLKEILIRNLFLDNIE